MISITLECILSDLSSSCSCCCFVDSLHNIIGVWIDSLLFRCFCDFILEIRLFEIICGNCIRSWTHPFLLTDSFGFKVENGLVIFLLFEPSATKISSFFCFKYFIGCGTSYHMIIKCFFFIRLKLYRSIRILFNEENVYCDS